MTAVAWRWRGARLLESLGRSGWIGLGALALALAIAGSVLRNMNDRLHGLENAVAGGKSDSRDKEKANVAPTALARLLPGTAAATEFAALLPKLAMQENVRLERSEYQMQRESGKPIVLYRGDLVVSGPYLKLRAWLDAVLRERPTVAIDEMIFERPNGETPDVTLRIRLTLFMKGDA